MLVDRSEVVRLGLMLELGWAIVSASRCSRSALAHMLGQYCEKRSIAGYTRIK
jgi:hypothetical protein